MTSMVSFQTFERAFPGEQECRAHMFFHSGGLAHRCMGNQTVPRWRPMASRSSYYCPACWTIEGVRAQTTFKGTRVPVRTLFYAMLLMVHLPGNASIGFLKRQLGMSHKGAHALADRIRVHMAALEVPRIVGGPGQMVYIDETLVRLQGEAWGTCIFGMTDKRSLFLSVLPDRRASTILPLIEQFVAPGSVIVTDECSSYRRLAKQGWVHHRLNHSRGVWTDQEGRTNASIELVWRWLKRQLAGGTGQIAHEHLWKHIKQFLYKFHARQNPAEAYWRLISTYPPLERYQEDVLRREVDRW